MTDDAITVFFSYSHKDEDMRDELAKHLTILRRTNVIADWYDRDITAGTEWKPRRLLSTIVKLNTRNVRV
ncbi:MAG: hypothetical protein AAFY20_10235 [Cyanobacteria bacterium J06639_14]